MAGEGDECKWVGIRPTNPAENIPVKEATPLTDIKVSPSAGNPEFLTLTEKRSPAISDLQAIKDQILFGDSWTQSGAADVTKTTAACPAGEIWVITVIGSSQLSGTCSHMYHMINDDTDDFIVNGVLAPTARNFLFTRGPLILNEDDFLKIVYGSLSNGAYTTYTVCGYKIGLY